MPIWVRVRLKAPHGAKAEASAKLNTGFTIGPFPFVRVPRALAEKLGFNVDEAPLIPRVRDAAGRALPMRRLGVVEVKVVEPDRESRWVRALAVFTGAPSVLINDVLIEELGVEPVRPGSGFWRFSDDPAGVLRRSAPEEYF